MLLVLTEFPSVVGFQPVWTCGCVPLCICMSVLVFLGDKSLMWMMDSPGVSMMSRRRHHRSRKKVGPISHSTSLSVNISFPTLPSASYENAFAISFENKPRCSRQPNCALRIQPLPPPAGGKTAQLRFSLTDIVLSLQRRHLLLAPASRKSPLRWLLTYIWQESFLPSI